MGRIIRKLVILIAVMVMFSGLVYAESTTPTIDMATYNDESSLVEVYGGADSLTVITVIVEVWNSEKELLSFTSVSTSDNSWNTSLELGILPDGTYTVKVADYNGGPYVITTFAVADEEVVSAGGRGRSTPSIIITTEEVGDSNTTKTEISSNISSGSASASITKEVIDALLNKANATGGILEEDVIEVIIDIISNIQKLEVTISQSDLDNIITSTQSDLRISSSFLSIAFDGKALEAISDENNGGSIQITTSIAGDINGRPIYDFTVTNGGEIISEFGSGKVTIAIPYTLKPDENPNAVVVYYLADDGSLKTVMGHYDESSKTVVFTTTHFSKYVIGYNHVAFNDVPIAMWYKQAVDFVAARGIASGTGNDNYSPDAKLTRAQFLVMAMNAYNIAPEENPTNNFSDAGRAYYTGYLAAAKNMGISEGVGNNIFAPNQEITRQEMFTLLYNILRDVGELPTGNIGKEISNFADANQIAPWANDSMTLFVSTGTITGNDGKISPMGKTSRAEMAQVLYNLLSK